MATYDVTAPDGSIHEVTAPDEATEEQVLAYAQQEFAATNPEGIGHTLDKRRLTLYQHLTILKAQLTDPNRDTSNAEGQLQQEIAQVEKQIAALPPEPHVASQSDVRAVDQATMTPLENQNAKEAEFSKAMDEWMQTPAGQYYPGPEKRDMFAKLSGRRDPLLDRQAAEIEHLAQTGEPTLGNSTLYKVAKPAAAIAGFVGAGPIGGTGAELVVRYISIASNLDAAVKAGAIDKDQASEIFAKELVKGVGEDALFNFGIPIIGRVIAKIPGVKWLGDKTIQYIKDKAAPLATIASLPSGTPTQLARVVASRAGKTDNPAAQQAVEELSSRTAGGVVPTPGQVSGNASVLESAARVARPGTFEQAQQELAKAGEGMRQDLVNPAGQPRRVDFGKAVQEEAYAAEDAVKKRLRPAFDAADKLEVKTNLQPVADRIKVALAEDTAVPGKGLEPGERGYLESIVRDIENTGKPAVPAQDILSMTVDANGNHVVIGQTAAQAATPVQNTAQGTLDFISTLKAKLRATPEYKPTLPYERLLNDLMSKADTAYKQAAAGKGQVTRDLMAARADYHEMMNTVHTDAMQNVLKKSSPEDVGGYLWQTGNVTELRQFQQTLAIAKREGTMSAQEAEDLSRKMTRGFMQEAIPDLKAAASWSETLASKPKLRDTWDELTSAPGGQQLRNGMEVLEQAAKIALRDNPAMLGEGSILMQRAAKGGLGISYVTGAFHPGFAVAGLGLYATARLMGTAYTHGDTGGIRLIAQALRSTGIGTPAAIKSFQSLLPELQKLSDKYDVPNIFVGNAETAGG